MLKKKHISILLFFVLFPSAFVPVVFAWGNGGYSVDPSNPDYGTHDWIAQHALDWLPSNEKEYIVNNLVTYLYGTELPDNGQATDGIGDNTKHHIYFDADGTLQDNSSAVRALEEYIITLGFLISNDSVNAAKHAGIMSHYIADVAVFGHVMGSYTYWGAEQHHSDYENYVNSRTNRYDDDFNTYLSYDGKLDIITAYDAAVNLTYDTTFDVDGELTCVWMDQNYDWSNPVFKDRCGESLNLAVNYLADVLHTLYMSRSDSSSITCEVSPHSLVIGDAITVSGSISPTRSSVPINISYRSDGSWSSLTTLTSASDGSYSYSWTPESVGSYQLKSSWEGDSSYSGATSNVVSVTVTKISTTISCSFSPSEVVEGSSITFSGSISPAVSGKTVTLIYKKPNGSTFTRTATTGSDGSYSDSYTPDVTGPWSVTASWEGESTYEGASSSSKSFTVKMKSGCLIATATYGSELSPKVQFLRGFRDNTVMTTSTGSSFMRVFNNIYYSFSPTVASAISSSAGMRSIVKAVLYPLMGILHLGVGAYSLFSFSPDLGILVFCLVVSSLMSVVYLAPWALLFSFLRKKTISSEKICVMSVVWVGSVAVILVAEVTKSPLLMMAGGGVFVLATACLTTLAVTRTITKRLHSLNFS